MASCLRGHALAYHCTRVNICAHGSVKRHCLCTAAAPPLQPEEALPPQPAQAPHVPVLLEEVLQAFAPLKVKVYVDGTLGAGGHACAVAQAHPELTTLVGVDLDRAAHAIASQRLARLSDARPALAATVLHGNYSQLQTLLASLPGGSLVGRVDALLLDLGVSSMQLDTPERGFSFSVDGPLDMRMDPGAALSAEEVVNTWGEEELGRVLREYGEERMWWQVARRIVDARARAPIHTTQQLAAAVGRTQLRRNGGGGSSQRRKGQRGGGEIHPATRTFQALRIVVNDELRQLEQAVPAAVACLAPGGRLGVISFHSLEDRLVKHALLRAAGKPTPEEEALTRGPDSWVHLEALAARALGRLITRKPLVATPIEVAVNPRARSAKLRVFERAAPAA